MLLHWLRRPRLVDEAENKCNTEHETVQLNGLKYFWLKHAVSLLNEAVLSGIRGLARPTGT